MTDELIFSCWCIFFSKLKIYKNRVEIGRFFGLATTTIPIQKIASVHKGISGMIRIETTGGGRVDQISPWSSKKRQEVVNIILKLIESH